MNITIYTKRACPNCETAKKLLEGKGRFYLAWNGSRFSKSSELKRASKAAPNALWRAQEHLLGAFSTAKCSRAHALHTHAHAG